MWPGMKIKTSRGKGNILTELSLGDDDDDDDDYMITLNQFKINERI